MADFFVMTRDDEFRRLEIEQGLQNYLGNMFMKGAQVLRDQDLEVVSFGRFAFQPDETQVLRIDGFDLSDHLKAAVDEPIACPSLAPREDLSAGLKAVVSSFPNEGMIAFQAIDRRRILEPRGLTMILDDGTFRRIREPGLQLSEDVHAVLEGRSLRFRTAYWARRIFDISAFYIEATEEEVDSWITREDIKIEGDPEEYRERLSQWERKRIGFILDSGILDHVAMPVIQKRAKEYGLQIDLETDDGKERLVVPENASARRNLIKFLEEDYYRGPLSNNVYIANSKRPM